MGVALIDNIFHAFVLTLCALQMLVLLLLLLWPDHLGLMLWSVHSCNDWLVFVWTFSFVTLSLHVFTRCSVFFWDSYDGSLQYTSCLLLARSWSCDGEATRAVADCFCGWEDEVTACSRSYKYRRLGLTENIPMTNFAKKIKNIFLAPYSNIANNSDSNFDCKS